MTDDTTEIFDLVNEQGEVIGQAPRRRCHGDPSLLHRSIHVFVFNRLGHLFLQKRSARKDIQPGMWDTSVGGHVDQGEAVEAAVTREMSEELGITDQPVAFLHRYIWRTEVESELVHTYRCTHEGPFSLQVEEIDEGRFVDPAQLPAMAAAGLLTPNLLHELGLLGLFQGRSEATSS